MSELIPEHVDTVVIGGSQAGLATGYHLAQRGIDHVILDQRQRVGDAWRLRWDSLKLFTPGPYNSLPGMPYPSSAASYPSKDEMADYLEAYAAELELPVRTGVDVEWIRRSGDLFEVSCGGRRLEAQNVVVATGGYHHPRIPHFAGDLGDDIVQLHSSEYQRPSQLRDGGVLVVGAGNSGAEIALDLADRHQVWLSGRDTGQEPTTAGSTPDRLLVPVMWFMAHRVLRVTTPMGRKVRDHFLDPPRGIPLGRVRRKDILAAGVERVPRTTGVRDGDPILEDGRLLEVANVVWCTGFVPDFSWIDLPVFGESGYPAHDRGIVESAPGLYFMGLPFQYSLSSGLVGGVGRDADHIVRHIESRRRPGTRIRVND